ncbi:MAG: hypothetical protein ACI4C3_00315 [Bacteroides sp.]
MIKNTNLCVDLKTVMQTDTLLTEGQCYNGILTRDGECHFRFEEAVRKGKHQRNPKLFDGRYISMVRMQNGRYQIHLKTMDSAHLDGPKFAFGVYTEIVNALKIID